jgi:hypothetical protein
MKKTKKKTEGQKLRRNLEVINGIREVHLDSWEQFSDHIKTEHSFCPALIYRGQGRADWPIVSKIDRIESQFTQTPNRSGSIPRDFNCSPVDRYTHLRAFKEAARGRRGQNPPDLTEDQWWALGQHHGLSTPLLDWTRSPFVALFFAFEDEFIPDEKDHLTEPTHRAVFSVSASAISDGGEANELEVPLPFSAFGETTPRIINQSGVFFRMPEKCDLEDYVTTHFKGECSTDKGEKVRWILEKVVIPNHDRQACLQQLNKMNINRMTLFPDLDGAARYVDALWELEFDTSLGYIPDTLPGY